MPLSGFTIPDQADAAFPAQAKVWDEDISILAAGFGDTGIQSGCAVTAQGAPDMTLAVALGIAVIAGNLVAVAAGNVTITTANATNPRFDLVVVDNAGALSVVAGTPDPTPKFPDMPAAKACLAAVYVPANDTAINTNQIIDKRVFIPYPAGKLLDSQRYTGGTLTVPTTAVDTSTSMEVPGLTVGWTQGASTVEVVFTGKVQFKGVSQAANQIASITCYICDLSQAANAAYDGYSGDQTLYQFWGAQTTRHLTATFLARTEVTAAPGTVMALSGRVYLDTSTPGARTTWEAKLLSGTPGLAQPTLQAREMR
jgi:hypothetical protein